MTTSLLNIELTKTHICKIRQLYAYKWLSLMYFSLTVSWQVWCGGTQPWLQPNWTPMRWTEMLIGLFVQHYCLTGHMLVWLNGHTFSQTHSKIIWEAFPDERMLLLGLELHVNVQGLQGSPNSDRWDGQMCYQTECIEWENRHCLCLKCYKMFNNKQMYWGNNMWFSTLLSVKVLTISTVPQM